jgi:hypothetical protein
MEALLDGLGTRAAYGDRREENNHREHTTWEYTSVVVFASMGAEIKSPPGNGPYSYWLHGQIYHLLLTLYQNEANKPGYRQVYIFDPAEATIKRSENQSNENYLAELRKRLDQMPLQFTDVHSHVKGCIT